MRYVYKRIWQPNGGLWSPCRTGGMSDVAPFNRKPMIKSMHGHLWIEIDWIEVRATINANYWHILSIDTQSCWLNVVNAFAKTSNSQTVSARAQRHIHKQKIKNGIWKKKREKTIIFSNGKFTLSHLVWRIGCWMLATSDKNKWICLCSSLLCVVNHHFSFCEWTIAQWHSSLNRCRSLFIENMQHFGQQTNDTCYRIHLFIE